MLCRPVMGERGERLVRADGSEKAMVDCRKLWSVMVMGGKLLALGAAWGWCLLREP